MGWQYKEKIDTRGTVVPLIYYITIMSRFPSLLSMPTSPGLRNVTVISLVTRAAVLPTALVNQYHQFI
jgi:hypothetical protein